MADDRPGRAMRRLGSKGPGPTSIRLDDPVFDKLSERELREQIDVRKTLIGTMVGTLYPRIVEDQIATIQERIEALR